MCVSRLGSAGSSRRTMRCDARLRSHICTRCNPRRYRAQCTPRPIRLHPNGAAGEAARGRPCSAPRATPGAPCRGMQRVEASERGPLSAVRHRDIVAQPHAAFNMQRAFCGGNPRRACMKASVRCGALGPVRSEWLRYRSATGRTLTFFCTRSYPPASPLSALPARPPPHRTSTLTPVLARTLTHTHACPHTRSRTISRAHAHTPPAGEQGRL